jgi:hypothetical protein
MVLTGSGWCAYTFTRAAWLGRPFAFLEPFALSPKEAVR